MQNNKPAFPQPKGRGEDDEKYGMSLRDYFAGQFLAGIANTVGEAPVLYYDKIAKDCYDIADAMLKQREK